MATLWDRPVLQADVSTQGTHFLRVVPESYPACRALAALESECLTLSFVFKIKSLAFKIGMLCWSIHTDLLNTRFTFNKVAIF